MVHFLDSSSPVFPICQALSLTPVSERILSASLKDLILCLGFPISEMGIFSPTCHGCCKGLNELVFLGLVRGFSTGGDGTYK